MKVLFKGASTSYVKLLRQCGKYVNLIIFFLGGAPLPQRCLSDPGADSPSVLNENGFRGHLLSKDTYEHVHTLTTMIRLEDSTCRNVVLLFLVSSVTHGAQSKVQTSTTVLDKVRYVTPALLSKPQGGGQ